MIETFLQSITPPSPWFWLSLGVVLAGVEMIVPGFFLIWLALAALVTGFVTLLLELSFPAQMTLFAVLAICIVYAARRWLIQNPIQSDDPMLNDRAGRLIGEVVTVVEPIENGQGRVTIGDSQWAVKGPDTLAGGRVRITGNQGGVLVVEAA
jgi:membrane protein implicated in regulation of membrane protease activity